jgi:PIN domain nuclease of toxin-antitoxin system
MIYRGTLMSLLLGTHIVSWLSTEPDRISAKVQEVILEADQMHAGSANSLGAIAPPARRTAVSTPPLVQGVAWRVRLDHSKATTR